MPARLKKIPLTIFQRFFRTETLGGLVVLGFGLAALAIELPQQREDLLDEPVAITSRSRARVIPT